MANMRFIYPSFFDNEDIATLMPIERCLYLGLWCYADKEGRLEDKPVRMKKTILGYDNVTAQEVDGFLNHIEKAGFIIRYIEEDKHYIQIKNFSKYQPVREDEPASIIPAPKGYKPPKPVYTMELTKYVKSTPVKHFHTEEEVPYVELALRDGTTFPVYNSFIIELTNAYPGVNVPQELKKMDVWLKTNKSKRKTRTGIERFVNGWLNRTTPDPSYQAGDIFMSTMKKLENWGE